MKEKEKGSGEPELFTIGINRIWLFFGLISIIATVAGIIITSI